MTPPVFFIDTLEVIQVGQTLTITGGEAKHMRVMRLEAGQILHLVDGRGKRAVVTFESATVEGVYVRVHEVLEDVSRAPKTTLVIALAKAGRDELAIEMATELGVDRVIAWQAQRSIVRWSGKKQAKALEKWANVLSAATKQARRSTIPQLAYASSLTQLVELLKGEHVLVMHESATQELADLDLDGQAESYALVVGPEGGITDEELGAMAKTGTDIVRLGQTVMRVSTAATCGLSVLNYRIGKYDA